MTASDQPVRDYADLTELLDHLEAVVRETAYTDPFTKRTTNAKFPTIAKGLQILHDAKRFRIVDARGDRAVAGYWPEHDPLRRGAA